MILIITSASNILQPQGKPQTPFHPNRATRLIPAHVFPAFTPCATCIRSVIVVIFSPKHQFLRALTSDNWQQDKISWISSLAVTDAFLYFIKYFPSSRDHLSAKCTLELFQNARYYDGANGNLYDQHILYPFPPLPFSHQLQLTT